ncbi:MAG: protein translocase subunit SecF, partial [Snodgrassella sp.]|nr:protein translocase subunit SecF [Snodgrassella sp.]
MEFFKIKRDIPFMSYGKLTTAISLITFILAVFFLVTRGLNFSVEFTGGTVMEVEFKQSADLNKIRSELDGL